MKSKAHILIVDDEPDVRNQLRIVLGRHYHAAVARHGEEAMEKIEVQHPDLIITDIDMPILNGIELLKLLKNNTFTAHIPVIMISAQSDDKLKSEISLLGASFLPKPFPTSLLLSKIEALLDGVKIG